MTIKLYYNISNAIPASTDPVHFRSFTIDMANDREFEQIKEQDTLIDRVISEDLIGIRRKLHFFLRTHDVKGNIDFLTSFFNAPYKWALISDTGYYFNVGTVASPVAVPVISNEKSIEISVSSIVNNGILLFTKNVYARPASPVISELGVTSSEIEVIFTTTSLRYNLYRSPASGGTYALATYSFGNQLLDVGLNNGTTYYYKGTVVTIGGESELSAEVAMATAP